MFYIFILARTTIKKIFNPFDIEKGKFLMFCLETVSEIVISRIFFTSVNHAFCTLNCIPQLGHQPLYLISTKTDLNFLVNTKVAVGMEFQFPFPYDFPQDFSQDCHRNSHRIPIGFATGFRIGFPTGLP